MNFVPARFLRSKVVDRGGRGNLLVELDRADSDAAGFSVCFGVVGGVLRAAEAGEETAPGGGLEESGGGPLTEEEEVVGGPTCVEDVVAGTGVFAVFAAFD